MSVDFKGTKIEDYFKGESKKVTTTITRTGVSSIENDTFTLYIWAESGSTAAHTLENTDITKSGLTFTLNLTSAAFKALAVGDYLWKVLWESDSQHNDLTKWIIYPKVKVMAVD